MVDGGSGSIMCAYSEINGQPMCANQVRKTPLCF